jgi:hypothetical protein
LQPPAPKLRPPLSPGFDRVFVGTQRRSAPSGSSSLHSDADTFLELIDRRLAAAWVSALDHLSVQINGLPWQVGPNMLLGLEEPDEVTALERAFFTDMAGDEVRM